MSFPPPLPPPEVLSELRRSVHERGIEVMTSTEVRGFTRQSVTLADGRTLPCDSVVVASGFTLFDATIKEEYGYGIYDNVFTSADIERMLAEGRVAKADGFAPEAHRLPALRRFARREGVPAALLAGVLHHGRQAGHRDEAPLPRGRRLQLLHGYPHVRPRLRGDVPRGAAALQHPLRARPHLGASPTIDDRCRSRPRIRSRGVRCA